jgi:site-specific recombinase XerD
MKHKLTNREQEELLGQPDPQYATELRNLVYLQISLNYGMRRTELMDLTWPRVDCQNGVIMLKDRLTNQVVKLSEPTVTLLNEWEGRQLSEWQKRRQTGDLFGKYVFTELDGTTLDEEYISKMMRMYGESAGIKTTIDSDLLHESYKESLT